MQRKRVITLLTDFGSQDAYVGIMKGVIAAISPCANVIDICHNSPPQDILHGAYLLSTSYKHFPRKTIHVAVIDPGVGSNRDIICAETEDYFFLAPNNGLLSLIAHKEKFTRITQITNNAYFLPAPGHTFHGRDIFAPVAAHLSLGIRASQLGNSISQLEHIDIPQPVYKKPGQLEGYIVHIDRFGNLVTNITSGHIKEVKSNYKDIEVIIGKRKIKRLRNTYAEVGAGEPVALIGSADFLEISVNQGDAQQYFRAKRGDTIAIRSTVP